MNTFWRNYQFEILIFVLALGVRLVFLFAAIYADGGDMVANVQAADGYYVISENIIHGNGYSSAGEPPYTPNVIRPPGMPYFLAMLYVVADTYWVPLMVEVIIGALLPIIGFYIARYVVEERRVAMAASIGLALEPFGVAFSSLFYSETVFAFLLLLSLWAFCVYLEKNQWRPLLASGGLLAMATLTKPTAQYIIVIYAAAVLWQMRHSIRTALPRVFALIGLFFLILSPWLYRNYQTFGVVALSPQLGEQLAAVLVPSVLSIANSTSFQTEFTAALARGIPDPNQASLHETNTAISTSVATVLMHPYALAIVTGNTALNFFIHDGMFEVLKRLNLRPPVLLGKPALFMLISEPGTLVRYIGTVVFEPTITILFARIFWIVVTILFFFGTSIYVRTRKKVAGVVCVSIVAYFMLTTLVIGLSVTARYRMPINYLILLFAAYGAWVLYTTKIQYWRHGWGRDLQ